jgi:hypothetical protein
MIAAKIKSVCIEVWDLLALALVVLGLFFVSALSLPLPSVVCAQDIGVMLDAGWRFYQGQQTHVDYRSPLGPLFAMLFGVPFLLFGPDYSALRFLPVAVSALVSLWALLIVRKIVPQPVAFVSAVGIGLFAGGIFHPGFAYQALTFATFYNRVAFGLLSIVTLCCLLPRDEMGGMRQKVTDFSVGLAAGCLLFLKANFFVLAAVPLGLSLLLFKRSVSSYVYLAAGFVGVFLLIGASIGFRFDLMWADLSMAAIAREGVAAKLFFYPTRNFLANWDYFAVAVVISSVLLIAAGQSRELRKAIVVALSVYWVPTLMGFVITLMQSHGDGRSFPTMLAGGAAACAWLGREKAFRPIVSYTVMVGVILQGVILSAPHLGAYGFLSSLKTENFLGSFDFEPLRAWRVGAFNSYGEDFVPLLNEGASLVATNTDSGSSLQYIDFANNINLALHKRSPKGAMLWWDNGSTYSAKSFPSQQSFEDTDYVLIPTTRAIQPLDAWFAIYGEFLQANYEEAARSANFLLLRKKVHPTGG